MAKLRVPLIAGNWKMYKTINQSVEHVKQLKDKINSEFYNQLSDKYREVLVCPPFTALASVHSAIVGSKIKLGSQNMYCADEGAFTGDISPVMIKDAGCSHVIIGHSERREIFKETNSLINNKVIKALQSGLIPILCVGEKLAERESGITEQVVKEHIVEGFKSIDANQASIIVVAYEPVWAIGTGKTATPNDAQSVHSFIRQLLINLYSKDVADKIRILYGGSVKPDNVDGLMSMPDIDGALVGGASLKVDDFVRIIEYK